MLDAMLYSSFCLTLLLAPLLLTLRWYLSLMQLLTSVAIALALPIILAVCIYRHQVARQTELRWRLGGAAAIAMGGTSPLPHLRLQQLQSVWRHWTCEAYQGVLTLLACATYLFYTYHIEYRVESAGDVGSYALLLTDVTPFVQVECFLLVSLALDYLIRLMHASDKLRHTLSFYSCIDLLSFGGVAYFSLYRANLAPQHNAFNFYLLQGAFRFLRLRRVLKSLDWPIRSRSGLLVYRLGPLLLSKRVAFFCLFALRLLLFICIAAALVLAAEFPCQALTRRTCSDSLQSFHNCIYFIIVTLSTVGYGDVTCATDWGRMLMSVVIVVAAIQVPREVQRFFDMESEQKEHERVNHMLRREGVQSNQHEQMQQIALAVEARNARREHAAQAQQQQLQAQLNGCDWDAPEKRVNHTADFSSIASPNSAFDESHLLRVLPYSLPQAAFPPSTCACPPPSGSPATPAPFSSSSSPASSASLQAFLCGDSAFLCRWAELQLATLTHRNPQQWQRILHALDINTNTTEQTTAGHKPHANGSSWDSAQARHSAQVQAVVQSLFGTAPPLSLPVMPIMR